MILAQSAKQAEQAVRAVHIEYEDLPAIFTIEEAIEKESYFQHFRFIKNGDPDRAFANADHVFSGTARMGGQEHFYLETQACIAVPKPEDGEMEIFSSTQNPAETQAYVAKVTGVPANRILARVKRMGGGFGGKETRSIQLAAIVAVAANKVRRPVRCMLNRDEDILTSGQRHPFLARWKVAVNRDGRLQALDADVFANGGWSQDLSGAVVERSLTHIDGVYHIPNIHVRGRVAKTNTVSNTAFRGFGGPQGMFIAETYMTEVADRLGMPVERLREINFYKPENGMKTHFNQELEDWFVPLMYQQVLDECDYARRRGEIDAFNARHKWRKRGLAIIPTKFGISFTAVFLNQAGALVHIYHDGSVLVAHGGTEMGQGLHTKMTMIAAEALQVPQDAVLISETATNTVANAFVDGGVGVVGPQRLRHLERVHAAQRAARAVPGPSWGRMHRCNSWRTRPTSTASTCRRRASTARRTWATCGVRTGARCFFYFTQGVAAAEVEVDTLTGDWTCLRADLKMDVGHSIKPGHRLRPDRGRLCAGHGPVHYGGEPVDASRRPVRHPWPRHVQDPWLPRRAAGVERQLAQGRRVEAPPDGAAEPRRGCVSPPPVLSMFPLFFDVRSLVH